MNFTDLPRYLLRKNSLIDVGVAFFDFADSHESTEKQKLIGQEPSPNHQQRPRQAQTIIAVFGIAMSMGFGSAFSQTAAVSVNNDAAKRSPEIHWPAGLSPDEDRKSTRLNSSHTVISYAVFCLKKKKI